MTDANKKCEHILILNYSNQISVTKWYVFEKVDDLSQFK